MVVFFELVARFHAAVDGDYGVQAVQLVRHGCGVDGGVGPDDGGGEVVVERGVGDGLEAHADCCVVSGCGVGWRRAGDGRRTGHEFVPGAEDFGLEEV